MKFHPEKINKATLSALVHIPDFSMSQISIFANHRKIWKNIQFCPKNIRKNVFVFLIKVDIETRFRTNIYLFLLGYVAFNQKDKGFSSPILRDPKTSFDLVDSSGETERSSCYVHFSSEFNYFSKFRNAKIFPDQNLFKALYLTIQISFFSLSVYFMRR